MCPTPLYLRDIDTSTMRQGVEDPADEELDIPPFASHPVAAGLRRLLVPSPRAAGRFADGALNEEALDEEAWVEDACVDGRAGALLLLPPTTLVVRSTASKPSRPTNWPGVG